jgi:hypothetical protein
MSDQDDSTIEPDDVVTDPDDDGQGDGDTDQLGDAGKKALDSMKGRWREERDRRKALEARIAELEQGSGKKDDGDLVQAIAKAKAEAKAETLRERVLDRIEAKAARLFADPEDAVALLGRRADEFIDGDKIDSDEIAEALEGLLKKKPHLAATAQKRFAGSADGGARKGSKPDQLTRDDLKKMTPAAIVKAQEEGRLNDLMGVD